MDADSTHKTPHCVRNKRHRIGIIGSMCGYSMPRGKSCRLQALQQLNIHFGTALNDTIETLAMDAELRILLEKGREDDLETG
ncbi:hypothetical protein [Acidithiobacillus thiooxidans]|uniref:Uncharacterized protein n=1 Tax=Acidithiobacillus thiooxidans TaxID=930 RepID=A0A1C2I376_ACITH|nr:hypothetical protein [Acidithiobacillus thiooxidans]OCX70383.1 hypothetical protein A6M23_14100 [Acidithiobacillus thiooxidans]OCX86560.1 hypothetical protein A6P08_05455 [Acidithiobacillus thiooxidans]